MIRLLLIIVLLTQMGCGTFIETTVGTFVGSLGATITDNSWKEVIDKTKEAIDKEELTEENSGDE